MKPKHPKSPNTKNNESTKARDAVAALLNCDLEKLRTEDGDALAMVNIIDPNIVKRAFMLKKENIIPLMTFCKNPTVEMQRCLVQKNPMLYKLIHRPAHEIRKEIMLDNPNNVKFLGPLSREEQLFVTKDHPLVLPLIANPLEDVQLKVYTKRPADIVLLRNPSRKAILLALRLMPRLIVHFEHLRDPEFELEALRADYKVIRFMLDPSPTAQLYLLKTNMLYALLVIKSFCLEAQQFVVLREPHLAVFFVTIFPQIEEYVQRNTGNRVLFNAINRVVPVEELKQDPFLIRFIKAPTREQKLAAVDAIAYIKDADEEIQLAAYRKNSDNIFAMKTPHEKVLTIAMEENSFLFPTMWRRLSPEILARMIENEPKLAIYVDGLSIEMQHAIVKKNPHYALYLHTVSEEVQMEMVRGSPWQLFNVFPQCESAQLYAVAQSSGFYRVLSNPSVKTRSYLLKHDPVFAAQWVTKLTLEEKLALIAADRRCLFFIEQLEDVLEFLLEVQVCRFGIAMAENTLSSSFWVSPPSDSQVDANVSCKNYDKVLWKQLRAELLAPRFCV